MTITNKVLKVTKIRNTEYYDMTYVFDDLYAKSLKKQKFTNLLEIIQMEENIKLAYRNMRKNSGGRTPGIDNLTINHINSICEDEFLRIVKSKMRNYHLKKRLNLEISEDKSKITNLRKEYSEFLGFKMKVYQKGDKWKVKSHMCDKAYDRTRKELKKAMDVIKDTEGSANTGRAISIYNAKVIGIHQYFQLATMISEDVSKISYEIQHKCKSRKLERRIERTGRTKQGYIEKIYGASKQLRYINEVAIAPIGYCKHKNPMYKKKKVNKYTPEGRELIYKNISVSQTAIQYMLNNPIENRSIEYNDNRISLYVGQQGKCAVTGNVLDFYNMHCHHKIPRKMGGTDEYNNLVIVEREVHTLIHAVDEEVIAKLLGKLSLDKKKLAKLNTLRTESGNKAINW